MMLYSCTHMAIVGVTNTRKRRNFTDAIRNNELLGQRGLIGR